MGTNFYAHIIPTHERKTYLKNLINDNNNEAKFNDIINEINKTYDKFKPINQNDIPSGIIHIGKKSFGWKFLFNPNIFQIHNGHLEFLNEEHTKCTFIQDEDTPYFIYPTLTKQDITNFINRTDVTLIDEYNEIQNKQQFIANFISDANQNDNTLLDSDEYYKKYPNEKQSIYNNNYTNFLQQLGFKLSNSKQDFYNDNLRFATSNEFS